jgi:spermidine synthase
MTGPAPTTPQAARERRFFLGAVGALGVSCVVTQLVLMRELLCAFTGNELVLGVVLGNWLLLMGVGAWLGRRTEGPADRTGVFLWTQILLALVPLGQVFAVRTLRNEVFVRGAAVGFGATVGASLVVLLPYCLAAGFLLALACALRIKAGDAETGAGQVYIADSVGSIVGGALFSLVLLWAVNSFALLGLVGLLNLASAALLAWHGRRKVMAGAAVVGAVGLVLVAFVLNTDAVSTAWQHPGEEVLFHGHSPYGQLVVTRAGNQINFYQNGLPVVSTHNTGEIEEAAHYAMAQRPAARRVLLIGGGVSGTAKELLKYRAQVTCVELDPLFLKLGRRFLPENLNDPRLRLVTTDGRRFVQGRRETFDVIIIDLADPVTAQLNRFRTAEFLTEAKRSLTPGGVLALAVGRYENFVSPELGRVLATAHATLRCAFDQVLMLPGARVFFLASDGPLGLDIAERLERAKIPTQYVNRHYLDATLTPDRVADLRRAVAPEAAVNRDFRPVLYFHCLRLWASQFNPRFGVAGGLLVLGLAVYVMRLRGAAVALFVSGFAASSLQVVLLLAFQALCGSLYYQLGIIVTVFMAGLAAGATWAIRLKDLTMNLDPVGRGSRRAELQFRSNAAARQEARPTWFIIPARARRARKLSQSGGRDVSSKFLAWSAISLAVLSLLLPPALRLLSRVSALHGSDLIVQVCVALLTFVLAANVGAQFPLANRVELSIVGQASRASLREHAAARLYTADFMGAFLGALLASALLVPLLGVTGVCLLAAALNALAGGALFWRKSMT